jgi:ferredoxin--NADP+ reductase
MEYVVHNLDQRALDDEIARVTPQMAALGQDLQAARAQILEALPKALPSNSTTRFRFEFLASPTRILGDKQVIGLEVEDNNLALKDGEIKARGTGNKRLLNVDSVVFAIGDKVDESFGLPTTWNEFAKNPAPRFPVEGISYETYNPALGQVIPDVFVAGWSRQASTGLVGYARKDGTQGSRAVLQYLQSLGSSTPDMAALKARLKKLGKPIVTQGDVRKLIEIEAEVAHRRGLPFFKFGTNEEMLEKIMSVG